MQAETIIMLFYAVQLMFIINFVSLLFSFVADCKLYWGRRGLFVSFGLSLHYSCQFMNKVHVSLTFDSCMNFL